MRNRLTRRSLEKCKKACGESSVTTPAMPALALAIATFVGTLPSALADEGLHRGQFDINVLSSRPYLVSGGSALVEVDVPKQVDLTKVHVYANGADVTSAFRANA